jgi:hypothetical protein
LTLFQEAKLLLPYSNIQAVGIHEKCISGFGDRLRGIAVALFLARFHNVKTIYYNDSEQINNDYRYVAFPYLMCDLIKLDTFELVEHTLPFPEKTLFVTLDSERNTLFTRCGFKFMRHVEPKNDAILARLNAMKVGRNCIGVHVRGTDAANRHRFRNEMDYLEERALKELDSNCLQASTKRVFLASDNEIDRSEWLCKLKKRAYDVSFNAHTIWNADSLRQTNANDMLIDFFGLSRCDKIVRLIPSEFSKFASWVGGVRLHYWEGFWNIRTRALLKSFFWQWFITKFKRYYDMT